MLNWGPVFVAAILFILLSPGLLFQLPGNRRWVEFGNFQTSGAAMMIHTLFYFALICVFLIAVKMADWGPVVIAVVLFVLLSPGLLFQLPGRNRVVEFGNMQTSIVSIVVHTVIFFGLITIFLIAIGVHISTDSG
ncbi:hypothetical protein ACJIZ3_004607 [Penstemon smallii]|uniref:Transmembrane protein n=1 Tax=Penstemon smallii TaxID=265156 RepID=A0ABD3S2N4_9LAMI